MAQQRKWELVLTGPYAGRTIELNDYLFVEGSLKFQDSFENIEGVVTYMGRSYQAYLVGSPELRHAQERDRKNKEIADGERDIPEGSDSGEQHDTTGGVVQPTGKEPTETETVNGEGPASTEAGAEGDVPGRDGHADAGVPDAEAGPSGNGEPRETGEAERQLQSVAAELVVAVKKALDPDDDSHWNTNGKPAMEAVAIAAGSEAVTRKDVEAALPGWDRAAARKESVEGLA